MRRLGELSAISNDELLKLLRCLRADEMLGFARIYLSLLRSYVEDVRQEIVEDVLPHQHGASHGLSLFGEGKEFVLVLKDEVLRLEGLKVDRGASGRDVELPGNIGHTGISSLLSQLEDCEKVMRGAVGNVVLFELLPNIHDLTSEWSPPAWLRHVGLLSWGSIVDKFGQL
jgi:hypothetical protein